MKAQIIATTHSCQEVFPIIGNNQSIGKSVGLTVRFPLMKLSVHEDNDGAVIISRTLPKKIRPVVSIMQPRRFGFVKR